MKKGFMCLTLCLALLISSISFAESVDNKYKKTYIEIEREDSCLNNDEFNYRVNGIEDYFEGWSEEDAVLKNPGRFDEYWLYQKRAVASSVGYNGTHYLRAYVELYKSSTDTDRVYRDKGFTLRSGWAYNVDFPVVGRARAFYGLD